jgi:hypothetical protein
LSANTYVSNVNFTDGSSNTGHFGIIRNSTSGNGAFYGADGIVELYTNMSGTNVKALSLATTGAATFSNTVYSKGYTGYRVDGGVGIEVNGGDLGSGSFIAKFNDYSNNTKVAILGNGNVGIGTTVPLAKATVRGGNLGNTIAMASTVFSVQGNDQGIFMGSLNGTPNYGSWIQAGREAFDIPFILALQPNGGNVLIGTTTDNGLGLLQLGGTNNGKLSLTGGASQNGMRFESVATANTFYLFNGNYGPGPGWGIYNVTTAGLPFWIQNSGAATFSSSVTATSFFESSDSRLKTLIQDNYQTKGIASITPKLYTKNGKVELGYYAQDFIGVLDSAVSKGSDDMLSLSYREVHTAKIYALEQRIKELENK